MRTDYTANGMHKDDPINPQSHWNDWSIDRDGNKLKECKSKNIKEIKHEIKEEINTINERLVKCYKGISEGRLDTFGRETVALEKKKEGLELALSKF